MPGATQNDVEKAKEVGTTPQAQSRIETWAKERDQKIKQQIANGQGGWAFLNSVADGLMGGKNIRDAQHRKGLTEGTAGTKEEQQEHRHKINNKQNQADTDAEFSTANWTDMHKSFKGFKTQRELYELKGGKSGILGSFGFATNSAKNLVNNTPVLGAGLRSLSNAKDAITNRLQNTSATKPTDGVKPDAPTPGSPPSPDGGTSSTRKEDRDGEVAEAESAKSDITREQLMECRDGADGMRKAMIHDYAKQEMLNGRTPQQVFDDMTSLKNEDGGALIEDAEAESSINLATDSITSDLEASTTKTTKVTAEAELENDENSSMRPNN